MRAILFWVIFLTAVSGISQTVLNSSMEDPHPSLPGVNFFSMDNCNYWYMTYNSSDWLTPVVGSDGMTFGYEPHTGTGHAGLAGTATITGGNVYKEMITGTITGLVSGQSYEVSFFVRNDNGPTVLNVGAYISSSIPNLGPNPYTQTLYPQIDGILMPDGDYHEITGCFTADFSGTGYITIGVFEVYSNSIEGQITNYLHVDDVTIQPTSAPLPIIDLVLDNEFCPASDIIADWSGSSGYTSYVWSVSSQNEDEIFATSGMQTTPVTSFDVRNALVSEGEFPATGNCYKVTLRLYNAAGCYVEQSKNFCMIHPTITITDDGEPHCEGVPFELNVSGAPSDWLYTWSNGQSGVGLTTINPVANTGVTTYSVTATTPSGCNTADLLTDLVIHQNPNVSPTLQSTETHFYVQMGEQLCVDFYSVDNPNEFVTMELISSYTSTSTFNFSLIPIAGILPNQDAGTFCLEVNNFWESGEYTFGIKLVDGNACGALNVVVPITIDVLCPSCPEELYIDYRNPDHDEFFEGTIDAASKLYLGTVDLFPGHEVDPGFSGVHFIAKDIILGPAWAGDVGDYTILPGYTCSNLCTDCCTEESQLSYDAPEEPYILTPDDDGDHDIFYVTDYSSPYDAYHATAWEFTVWPASGINWYPPSQVIWSTASINNMLGFSHACYIFETPTPEYPYNTFFWDGDFQYSGSVFIDSDPYFFDAGDPVPPGVYRYVVDLYGCKNGPGAGIIGHHLDFEGYITVMPTTKSAYNSTSDPESQEDWINEQLAALATEKDSAHLVEFKVYPNPGSGELFITMPCAAEEANQLQVRDVSGKIIHTTSFTGANYFTNLSNLARGTYFITVSNSMYEFTERIILH